MNDVRVSATRRPVPETMFGGRLRDAFLLDLEVVAVEDLAAHVRAFTFGSRDLVDFEWAPGQDLMLAFPDGSKPLRRRYTIRRSNATAGTVDLEFELHGGDGVAVQWATSAEVGSRLEAIGPRGTNTVQVGASAHLFVVDDSAMPAAFAMLEALPPGASATGVLVTPHGAGSRPLADGAQGHRFVWVTEEEVTDVLGQLPNEPALAAYVYGERGLVLRVVAQLVRSGIDTAALSSKAYWRRDMANASHGEPSRE